MDFIEYLQKRDQFHGGKPLSEKSALQYNSRLENMKRKSIYKGESTMTKEIQTKITQNYKDSTNHYPRTINYYLEYKHYIRTREIHH